MNRWPITIFQAATETERRHKMHSRAPSAIQKMRDSWSEIIAGIKKRLSISQSRSTWRIFEVKHHQYILFRRRSAEASRIAREKVVVGRAVSQVFDRVARI